MSAPAVRARARAGVVLPTLAVGLLATCVLAAGIGQFAIPPLQVLGSFLHHFAIPIGPMPEQPMGDATLWQVRFPRVALALLVGAALACAGAVLQGVFANPLAEPGVIGVSAGAAAGAAAVIVVGGVAVSELAVSAGAFVAGLLATGVVYALSRSGGRTEVVTLVLTGIAINAVAGGLIAYLTFVASPIARDEIVFWQLGSLNRATWSAVSIVAPMVLVGIGATMLLVRRLDLLALGEAPARHLGVDVERLRLVAIVLVALLTAAAVAFAGIILFVGLVIPHLMRLLVGPGHRVLVLASILAGALLLVVADLGARTLVTNADLPIGILTSLAGGPFFLYLLRRERLQSGGWA
ncbi:FecCD family ABC transporter permease [Skermania piniformis]|uniref:Iron ABC transporter permease n=1 Tax=Skermania pinensis TaxID=39122 RepID=A0ABX8SAX6_9ACTN|nr:iron ABC transporter permease [Skermania piniformis]QXQ15024.1 iron ABC transporter permease [Skermania piniformis]